MMRERVNSWCDQSRRAWIGRPRAPFRLAGPTSPGLRAPKFWIVRRSFRKTSPEQTVIDFLLSGSPAVRVIAFFPLSFFFLDRRVRGRAWSFLLFLCFYHPL
ncbi:hypothetical protein VTN96DRAFT_7767 [Rasamsonia emersonii]